MTASFWVWGSAPIKMMFSGGNHGRRKAHGTTSHQNHHHHQHHHHHHPGSSGSGSLPRYRVDRSGLSAQTDLYYPSNTRWAWEWYSGKRPLLRGQLCSRYDVERYYVNPSSSSYGSTTRDYATLPRDSTRSTHLSSYQRSTPGQGVPRQFPNHVDNSSFQMDPTSGFNSRSEVGQRRFMLFSGITWRETDWERYFAPFYW